LLQVCVVPPQVTFPLDEQLVPSTALHELLVLQDMVPPYKQVAVHLTFNGRGLFAAARAVSPVCGSVGSPVTTGCPRMAARAS
jgi:hypothetical protein